MLDPGPVIDVHETPADAQGEDDWLVLKWRRRGDAMEGLVTREVDGRVSTEWLTALVLPAVGRGLPTT